MTLTLNSIHQSMVHASTFRETQPQLAINPFKKKSERDYKFSFTILNTISQLNEQCFATKSLLYVCSYAPTRRYSFSNAEPPTSPPLSHAARRTEPSPPQPRTSEFRAKKPIPILIPWPWTPTQTEKALWRMFQRERAAASN